jgi:hypothetical protein
VLYHFLQPFPTALEKSSFSGREKFLAQNSPPGLTFSVSGMVLGKRKLVSFLLLKDIMRIH